MRSFGAVLACRCAKAEEAGKAWEATAAELQAALGAANKMSQHAEQRLMATEVKLRSALGERNALAKEVVAKDSMVRLWELSRSR